MMHKLGRRPVTPLSESGRFWHVFSAVHKKLGGIRRFERVLFVPRKEYGITIVYVIVNPASGSVHDRLNSPPARLLKAAAEPIPPSHASYLPRVYT